MSEYLKPEEFEEGDLPKVILRTQTGEIHATPFNTTLFTHLGRLAVYDHVFIETEQAEGKSVGSFMFRSHPSFDELAGFLVEHEYPMFYNRIFVPDCDLEAYDTMIASTMGEFDGIPDDWDESK